MTDQQTTTAPAPQMSGDVGHPLVRKIVDYQRAVAVGDLTAARTVFHEDVEYRVPGRSLLAGTYRGPDEVIGYFARLMDLTGGTYRISRMVWFATDNEVALATRNHATREDRTLDWDEVILFTFEDGRKKRIDLLSGDQYGMDDLFARS